MQKVCRCSCLLLAYLPPRPGRQTTTLESPTAQSPAATATATDAAATSGRCRGSGSRWSSRRCRWVASISGLLWFRVVDSLFNCLQAIEPQNTGNQRARSPFGGLAVDPATAACQRRVRDDVGVALQDLTPGDSLWLLVTPSDS